MKKIDSFKVNHLLLEPGLYVSRRDTDGNTVITTFDMRFRRPNREPVVDMPALHTIEHLGATFFRNSDISDKVIYFGPMGCRTGFYLVLFGNLDSSDIYDNVMQFCSFVINFNGDIPGASKAECGNWSEQNLDMAKYYVSAYKKELEENRNFTYPENL